MLIKLLYSLAPRKFNELVFNAKHASHDWKSNCEVSYVDGAGYKYYSFKDPLSDMPVDRLGRCQTLMQQMGFGFSEEEIDKFWECLQTALDNIVNKMDKSGRIKNLSVIGAAIQEGMQRKQMIVHTEILMDLAATMYIREDEDPAIINRTIHEEKLKQFEKDKALQNNHFFFRNRGLIQFMPQLKHFEENWTDFITKAETDLRILNEVMQATLELAAADGSNTPK